MDRDAPAGTSAPPRLARLDIDGDGDRFTLRLEASDGQVVTVVASRDQLDVIADHLEDALLGDAAAE